MIKFGTTYLYSSEHVSTIVLKDIFCGTLTRSGTELTVILNHLEILEMLENVGNKRVLASPRLRHLFLFI